MPGQLVSDWICICTAGTAIDGRTIEEQWLLEAAEHYDTSFYTAMVWPYHADDLREREFYTPNYGIIKELKTERVGEDLKLYARFAPNQFLIEVNKQSQKLFTSCEFWNDFQNKGFYYLQAVAVTDIPASVGTDMLQFSARNSRSCLGQSMQFSLGKLSQEKPPSLIDRIFSGKSPKSTFTPEPLPESEEDTVKMDELKQLLQQMMQAINEMRDAAKGKNSDDPDDAAEEVREQAEDIAILAEQVAELADDVADNPEDEVVAEEFTARREELADKMKAFTAGSSRFSARRRRAQRAFSATRKNRQNSTGVEKKIDQLIEAFSAAAGKGSTRLPRSAPGGSDKDIELL